jgi:hypothetical protein
MTSTPSVPKHLNFITGNKNKLAEVRHQSRTFPGQQHWNARLFTSHMSLYTLLAFT